MKYTITQMPTQEWMGVTFSTTLLARCNQVGPFLDKYYVAHLPHVTTALDPEALDDADTFLHTHQEQRTLDKIPYKVNPFHSIAGYTNYSRPIDIDSSYTYILGSFVTRIDTVPDGMSVGTVHPTTYAVFTLNGPANTVVPRFWEWLWSTTHDFQRDFSFDYELYDTTTDTITIYISIVP